MFKTTMSDDEIFVKEDPNEKPKKKAKRKCSERQLENLRKAREKAKQNRERRKREKEQKNNTNNNNMVIPQSNNNNNNTNVRFKVREVQETKPTKHNTANNSVIPNTTQKQTPKQPIRKQKKTRGGYTNFMNNNPLNINYTELIKHKMTLQHKTAMYNHYQKTRRNTLIRKNQVRNYENNNRNIQPVNKKVTPINPLKNINKKKK